ncbi:hypothetical protein QCA50_011454 [Cerrena zonata]|uniref:SH3 domain-containing protein n=1 Tax=Cerrena zonata TaxID=2478898 RepID=A0AAW0G772_9APHY
MSKPPLSSLTAFLNALSLLSSSNPKEPEFDAGLNASSAWTEARHSHISTNINSLSDDEASDDEADQADDDSGLESVTGRTARALFNFEGKAEFRELTAVQAGDDLEVLKEEVGDGWSLVRWYSEERREIGLLPKSYYTFTSDFAQAPDLELPPSHSRMKSRREASDSSVTPRGSPSHSPQPRPLVPQNTGEWFPSFRRSLLGGRSLNRFSNFVTSGAEEFVLQGSGEEIPAVSAHARDSTTSSIRSGIERTRSQVGGSGSTLC